MAAIRFFVNNKRVSTAVPLNDGTILQVYPEKKKYLNETAWRASWENSSLSKPSIRVEQEDASVRNVKKNWICPACSKGPGNDHRMCICTAFNYSVINWEIACGIRKDPVSTSPTVPRAPPATPSVSPSPVLNVKTPNETGYPVNDWLYYNVKKFTCPPGKYYIGDLCYVLNDKIYDTIYGGRGYEDGLYMKKYSNDFFFVAGTAYGDGSYRGSDGKSFGVDAGIIGICPASCMDHDDGGGHTYTFLESVECKFRGGVFSFISGFNHLTIDTAGCNDDECDDEI